MTASQPSAVPVAKPSRWDRFAAAVASGFQRYAEWLVGISWKKFFLLSVLLLIAAGILSEIPPFSLRFPVDSESATESPSKRRERAARLREKYRDVDIRIDHKGIHINRKGSATPQTDPPASPDPAATPPAPARPTETPTTPDATAPPKSVVEIGRDGVTVNLPPGSADEIRAAVEEARESIREAIEEEIAAGIRKPRVRVVRMGDFLPQLALLLIVVSMVIKIVYAGRVKAEVQAAEAQEAADAESLKRQVVEARMAAMQAQVEPHFLFNTLASIDHLIETDPARASTMQKNLIALLRASMPGMRESETNLGRELAVVRPYLEILRVRMGERLQAEVNVSAGLHSAEFPPMMLQSLVENAIKHGLEPKPEGGLLSVGAEVVHGRLEVSVADTGVGFGRAATAGTGVGLANIRERLKLLYGGDAELRIADHTPSGTRVTVVVPYKIANNTSRA